ncbi:MAG: isoprenylcysteine carboxylmethyltransferase family protein [Anaerolineales bacterium]|nr:isoprenylcysteine carboxylmethyltransferase family protein [Anaerolineales bacterium]
MNTSSTERNQMLSPDVKRGILKRAVQIGTTLTLMGLILFLTAGRLDWNWAWFYLAYYLLGVVINAIFLMRKSPDLIAERGEPKEGVKDWDRKLTLLSIPLWFLLMVIPGLDERFAWTPQLPLAMHVTAFAVVILGNTLGAWAMITNAFFSTSVRIQDDRGQTVVSDGPYRFVRHPGYTGFGLGNLALPVMLGSLWGLIPAILLNVLTIVRTTLEDRTLHEELPGYREYASRVRFRLLPGIW